MKNLKVLTFLFIMISANACDSSTTNDEPTTKNASLEKVDNFETKLTETGIFWQSENRGIITEFLFRKDGTVTALWHSIVHNQFEEGKWSYDKSNHNLQIAWRESEQVSTEVKSVESDWSKVYLSKDIYRFGNTELIKMKLLDSRFNKK